MGVETQMILLIIAVLWMLIITHAPWWFITGYIIGMIVYLGRHNE